jgi:hypothetical protein
VRAQRNQLKATRLRPQVLRDAMWPLISSVASVGHRRRVQDDEDSSEVHGACEENMDLGRCSKLGENATDRLASRHMCCIQHRGAYLEVACIESELANSRTRRNLTAVC